MLIIALPLALIAIVFGMKLLAQTKKDNLGNLFKYVSWFVIVMGFLAVMCIGCRAVMRHCCHGGGHEMMIKERCMMGDEDDCYMGHMGGCNMNMMGCQHMMGGCCGGMMMMHGGCGNMGGGCCNMSSDCGGSQCHGDMKSCCKDGDKGCGDDDDKGGCSMMMKGDKKDTSCCKKK